MHKNPFRSSLGENIFYNKYAFNHDESWWERSKIIVDDVCGTRGGKTNPLMSKEDRDQLHQYIYELKFLPGGRYIYYAGRQASFFNNCYLLSGEEDNREEWGRLAGSAMSCLTVGGGIGIDYSVFRPSGRILSKTGGQASGPLPLMKAINEIGRRVMQGGSRRSAIYASLNWKHEDVPEFLTCKNWFDMPITGDYTYWDAKMDNFDFPCPLDMTNISLNYDNTFLEHVDVEDPREKWNNPKTHPKLNVKDLPKTFIENCQQALQTGEPGFSFNFYGQENETLRNACTEVTSEDDSDVCNLGSVNMGAIDNLTEFKDVVNLASKFLVCGTIRATLPYDKVYEIREKNRRLGLGLMGIHEWLLKRNYPYEVNSELHSWLKEYKDQSERAANEHCDRFFISRPRAYRAIAPTGTIGMLAGTTTGIEPVFAVAYKRRYLSGDKWHYQYEIDAVANELIQQHGLDPSTIDTAQSLAKDPARRIKFQADVQDYVDMAISSTINLPAWGSEYNNEDLVYPFAETLASYSHRLRGFTCYPDGSRGGQPITEVPYKEAADNRDTVFQENDSCKGGVCGI